MVRKKEYSLKQIKDTYNLWGNHPILYKLSCIITFLGRENKLRRRAVDKLRLKKGNVVLDLACGTGLNFKYLEEKIGYTGKLIAFDYSKDMLRIARQRAKANSWGNIEFLQGDAAELSLSYNVNGVLSTLGISAIPDHRNALEKAINNIKNGGRISVLDARLPSGFLRIFNPLLRYVYRNWAGWDYMKDIPGDLERILGSVEIEEFNLRTIYIVSGRKNV